MSPKYDVHPVSQEKNGRLYYLLHTPYEGYTKQKAEEFSEMLINEKGFVDTFLEEVDGYYYVWGDLGISIEELKGEVERFTYIEHCSELLNQIYFSGFREDEELAQMQIRCHRCGHIWITQSQMNLVTCPSCSFKTPRKPVGFKK
ncbi:MAG: hypothetical protein ACFFCD_17905 [Promethearchaeota archaeon]